MVLFTSGSEGAPKGVVHSHRSLLTNCAQLSSVIDFSGADIVFNAMPMFHSFGATGAAILPLVSGVRTFHYPSPLHYRIIPGLIYDTDATIVFATDVFAAGWARYAHPYDFYSVRYLFAGAAKVRGRPPAHIGDTPWMDAALLQAAGVETVVFGATGAGAHADVEWVDVESVVTLAQILAEAALDYCQ